MWTVSSRSRSRGTHPPTTAKRDRPGHWLSVAAHQQNRRILRKMEDILKEFRAVKGVPRSRMFRPKTRWKSSSPWAPLAENMASDFPAFRTLPRSREPRPDQCVSGSPASRMTSAALCCPNFHPVFAQLPAANDRRSSMRRIPRFSARSTGGGCGPDLALRRIGKNTAIVDERQRSKKCRTARRAARPAAGPLASHQRPALSGTTPGARMCAAEYPAIRGHDTGRRLARGLHTPATLPRAGSPQSTISNRFMWPSSELFGSFGERGRGLS